MKTIHQIGLSLLSALLLSLSWPETGSYCFLIFFAFIPLFALAHSLKSHQWRILFLYSFFSFILWHILSDYWMLHSTIIGSITAWTINSFLMASVISLAFVSHKRIKHIRYEIVLAFYWLSFEILHLYWDLMWPWMNLGNVFANRIEWIQWYEYTGVYGGSFWIIIVNGLLFSIFKNIHRKQVRPIIYTSSYGIAILVLPFLFSYYLFSKEIPNDNKLSIAVLQPNIDSYHEKFDGLSDMQQSKKIVTQLINSQNSVDIYLLPETAIPKNFNIGKKPYPASIDYLLSWSKAKESSIIGGFYTHDSVNYNSALYIKNGEILGSRNKIKLLAFAESIPFEFIGKWIGKYIEQKGGISQSFGRDKKAKPFQISTHTSVGTLICFESVFPDIAAEIIRNNAQFLLIITNDDWWGNSAGYRQHFAFAKLRAIENRRAIARSANTGISGFINAKGETIKISTYKTAAVLSNTIFSPNKVSFFSIYEPTIRYLLIAISVTLFAISRIIRQAKD